MEWDIHRSFAEVVFWEDGRLRHHGRVDMTRSGLEGYGRSLNSTDEVVVEATGNAMAVVRVLSPFLGRVIVANPMQVKAISPMPGSKPKDRWRCSGAASRQRLSAGGLGSRRPASPSRRPAQSGRAAPHAREERGAWHTAGARRAEVPACRSVQQSRPCLAPWLEWQVLPDDERAAIARHIREIDRLAEDLAILMS
ncbi:MULTISPECIES: hypothetical protein [unclassified Mesorhizobium]|uniref:hypothetical protein n=1 Tax=unclassified Mesorhizobium TaxID=325217 RepID=UPI001FE1573E|nr:MULTISPECIES: hypothetical protein [unclassified Mesorhizobium]